MAEDIEILFEGIVIKRVITFLSALDTKSDLLYLRGTSMENDIVGHVPSAAELRRLFDNPSGGSFYFRFSDVRLFELQLPDAGIQVYRYDNTYDLSIDFVAGYFDRSGLPIHILQAGVGALAHDLKARMYCCGYEPVINLNDRFFTNSKLGPLGIPYHIEVQGEPMVINLVDIVFTGEYSSLDFEFIKNLMSKSRVVRFNSPEISAPGKYEEAIAVFNSNEYADLVVITDHLDVDGVIIPHVFINLTRDENEFELLFYFDLKEFSSGAYKEKFAMLEAWARAYKANYGFNYFVCQINHASEEEYYFDSNGLGPLYPTIKED